MSSSCGAYYAYDSDEDESGTAGFLLCIIKNSGRGQEFKYCHFICPFFLDPPKRIKHNQTQYIDQSVQIFLSGEENGYNHKMTRILMSLDIVDGENLSILVVKLQLTTEKVKFEDLYNHKAQFLEGQTFVDFESFRFDWAARYRTLYFQSWRFVKHYYLQTQKSNRNRMNRVKGPLAQFMNLILKQQQFPLKPLQEYLSKKKPNKTECIAVLHNNVSAFEKNCLEYRNVAIAVWLCASMNIQETYQQCLNFFGCLVKSRLLLLIFDDEGKFVLDRILLYLSIPMEITIRKALQTGMTDRIIKIIKDFNSQASKFNEILFILELIFIKKIQKHLQEDSLHQFNTFLKETLICDKYKRTIDTKQSMRFRLTALLRCQQESADTYQLTMKKGKLTKQIDSGLLPYWVVDAYLKPPQYFNLDPFKSRKVLDVYAFLCQSEVFASSSLIEEVDTLAKDDHFIQVFQQFLLGHSMGSGPYVYGCKSVHETVRQFRDKLSRQNQVYHKAITRQALNDFQ